MVKGKIIISRGEINYRFLNLQHKHRNALLVFLHDGLGSIEQWRGFPEKISNELKFPVLLYDRFGHGESGALKEKRNREYFSRESFYLNEILISLKINSKIILVGCSDGGTISLVYSVLFPEKVAGVITIAAHTFVEEKTIIGIKNLKEKYEIGNMKKTLSLFHYEKTDDLFYGWSDLWLSEDFRNWNIFASLGKIKCPVLSMQGDEDEYGTDLQLKSIEENVKSLCTVKIIKGAKHFPYLEKENDVVFLFKEFFDDILSGFSESFTPVRN